MRPRRRRAAGGGPPQPSAGRGEAGQRLPPGRRHRGRVPRPGRRRRRPPPPRIPEPPDSLAASAGGGEGPFRLLAAIGRRRRPSRLPRVRLAGARPRGHARPPPSRRSRALTGGLAIGPRPASPRFRLAARHLSVKRSQARPPRRFSLAAEGSTARGGLKAGRAEGAGPPSPVGGAAGQWQSGVGGGAGPDLRATGPAGGGRPPVGGGRAAVFPPAAILRREAPRPLWL